MVQGFFLLWFYFAFYEQNTRAQLWDMYDLLVNFYLLVKSNLEVVALKHFPIRAVNSNRKCKLEIN